MGELKPQMVIAVAIALLSAIGVGFNAVSFFPNGTPAILAPFGGQLYARQVTCSLSNGTCSMIIVNLSNASVSLDSCQISVVTAVNGSSRFFSQINGTLGSQATINRIPGDSASRTSCAISNSFLSLESKGSSAGGQIFATVETRWNSVPAGTHTGLGFVTTWS